MHPSRQALAVKVLKPIISLKSLTVLAGLVVSAISIMLWVPMPSHLSAGRERTKGNIIVDVPFVVNTCPRPLLVISMDVIDSLQDYFQPRLISPTTRELRAAQSLSVHALRVAGPNGRFRDDRLVDAQEVIRSFLDCDFGSTIYGQAPLCHTRYGLRYIPQSIVRRLNGPASETHDHQTLAALGELAVPLSSQITLDGQSHTLREVLLDAVQSFSLSKEELPWTAMAFVAYLPPQRAWSNKFGEEFTFDDLASKLINGDLTQSSCCGVHVLGAVVRLMQADKRFDLLTENVRRQLLDFVHAAVLQIGKNQNADGSWGRTWHGRGSTSEDLADSTDDRFLVTGHLGELLLSMPTDMGVGDDSLRRAAQWILPEIQARIRTHLADQFCPLTHAFCFVRDVAQYTESGIRAGEQWSRKSRKE